jgi:hypothetical protein
MDSSRLAALRNAALSLKTKGAQASVPPDELIQLLDSHAAALELADAVAAVLLIEGSEPSAVRAARRDERLSASEIRNRFRRRIEEATLRLKAALAEFRAAAGGTK